MFILNKTLERLMRLFSFFISKKFKINHKYQNKNQVTNSDVIVESLKIKNFNPKYIIDVGCGYGQWTKKLLKVYPLSNYFLFDADKSNRPHLKLLKKKHNNVEYKICLLSDNIDNYKFYNMGYGSSIFEEQTSHKRKIENILSTTLYDQIHVNISKHRNNLIKIDVQGAEIKVLSGLKNLLDAFEVIILEVSVHNYNKDSPLFNNVIEFMTNRSFKLYDIFDLKRLGKDKSFLLQFDCVFVRNDSNLLDVKF